MGWPQTVESLNLEHIFVHGFQMDGVCFKTITKSRYRGITQEKLEECFCHWAPLPYIPGHAEIESPEAQVQKE